jgi:hypothetical protein
LAKISSKDLTWFLPLLSSPLASQPPYRLPERYPSQVPQLSYHLLALLAPLAVLAPLALPEPAAAAVLAPPSCHNPQPSR